MRPGCFNASITVVARVLIVDDHPGFRAQARALLVAAGYQVVGEAADGESAVRAARELSPDVVLLDIHLPDADGFEVAAWLAALSTDGVVVLTSSRDACDFGPRITASQAAGFLPKAELSGDALRRYLPRRHR
jgi:DNA-binding NarL/FixJ family response regulator